MLRFLEVMAHVSSPTSFANTAASQEKKDKAMEDDVEAKYKVNQITIDQIELVGLQHVSMGSWQAHLRLRPRT